MRHSKEHQRSHSHNYFECSAVGCRDKCLLHSVIAVAVGSRGQTVNSRLSSSSVAAGGRDVADCCYSQAY